MRRMGWRTAYYLSLALFLAGILLMCLSGANRGVTAAGAGVVTLGGVVRFLWCRCPHCGAPMMRVKGDADICPRCLESLKEPEKRE